MPLKWHRRQAIVLASQLPDNKHDTLMVLQALQELVDTFLEDDDPAPDLGRQVINLS